MTTPVPNGGESGPAAATSRLEDTTLLGATGLAVVLLGAPVFATLSAGTEAPAVERPAAFATLLLGSAALAVVGYVALADRLRAVATGQAGAGESVWADVLAAGIVDLLALFGTATALDVAAAISPGIVPEGAANEPLLLAPGLLGGFAYVAVLRRGACSAPDWLTSETWGPVEDLTLFGLVTFLVHLHLGVVLGPGAPPAFFGGIALGATAVWLRGRGAFVPKG